MAQDVWGITLGGVGVAIVVRFGGRFSAWVKSLPHFARELTSAAVGTAYLAIVQIVTVLLFTSDPFAYARRHLPFELFCLLFAFFAGYLAEVRGPIGSPPDAMTDFDAADYVRGNEARSSTTRR